MPQRGRGAGVTGLVDFPGIGGGAKFEVTLYRYKTRLTGALRERRGRGGGVYKTTRWVFSSGSVAISGKFRGDGWPAPDAWKGQTGTITVQVDTGKTIAYPVIVQECGAEFDEKKDEMPHFFAACEVTGAPTFTGWTGTQPAATDPSKADQQQWVGSSITYDQSALTHNSVTEVDIWGTLTDTNAAELTKLTDVITATAVPITGTVKREGTLRRDALDGGTILITCGPRTHEQDITFPGTVTDDDASDLGDAKTITLVQSSVTPTPPSLPSGYKLRSTRTVQLTDAGKYSHTFSYGRRNPEDDVEMGGSSISDDPSDLGDTWVIVEVQSSSTPTPPATPAGLKLRDTITTQIHGASGAEKWRHQFNFARRDRQDDVEHPSERVVEDDDAVENSAFETVVIDDGDPLPTDFVNITAPADVKLVQTVLGRIHDGKQTVGLVGALNTPKEAVTRRQSRSVQGTSVKIGNEEIVVEFTTSATSDPTGKNPDGTNLDYHSSSSYKWSDTQWLHVHRFAPLTVEGTIEEGANQIDVDPGTIALIGDAHQCVVDTNASTPSAPSVSGRVCVRQFTKRRGKVGYEHHYFYDFRSNEDKMLAERTRSRIDASGIESSKMTADIWLVSGGEPSDPTESGYSLVDKEHFPTPNPLYTLTVYSWGLLTRSEAIEHGGTRARRQYFQPASGTVFTETLVKTCTSGDDVEELLATEVTTLEAVTGRPYFAVEVQKINKVRYRLLIDRPNDDKHVTRGTPRSNFEHYAVNAAGTNVRVVYAEPSLDPDDEPDTIRYVLDSYTYMVTRQWYRLRRYYRSSTMAGVDQNAIEGTRNSAASTFLGRAQYTMKFHGTETQFSWAAEGGSRWVCVEHLFEYCSLGHYESDAIPIRTVCKTTETIASGDTPTAASLGLANPAVTTLVNGGDFTTIFLA